MDPSNRDPGYWLPPDLATPATSRAFVDVVVFGGYVLLFAVAVWLAIRHARIAVHAARVHDDGRPLARGNALLVGTVETDPADSPAIDVTITQDPRAGRDKAGRYVRWTEHTRTKHVRPFVLRRANGERVRVLPDDETVLIDALDHLEGTGGPDRRRSARLEHGELASVSGVLVPVSDPGAPGVHYRGNGTSLALRAPKRGRMLVSTDPHGRDHRRRAVIHAISAVVALALFGLANGVIFGTYWQLRMRGETRDLVATEFAVRQQWVPKQHRWQPHYYVYARVAPEASGVCGDGLIVGETSPRAYMEHRDEHGTASVPFVLVPDRPSVHQVGERPAVNLGMIALSAYMLLIAAIAYASVIFRTRPWYERRRVVDVVRD